MTDETACKPPMIARWLTSSYLKNNQLCDTTCTCTIGVCSDIISNQCDDVTERASLGARSFRAKSLQAPYGGHDGANTPHKYLLSLEYATAHKRRVHSLTLVGQGDGPLKPLLSVLSLLTRLHRLNFRRASCTGRLALPRKSQTRQSAADAIDE